MKSVAMIVALLAVVLSAISQSADWTAVPAGASAIPAASSVAAPPTYKK